MNRSDSMSNDLVYQKSAVSSYQPRLIPGNAYDFSVYIPVRKAYAYLDNTLTVKLHKDPIVYQTVEEARDIQKIIKSKGVESLILWNTPASAPPLPKKTTQS